MGYRGRIAPSPTGFMHLGHARTFEVAVERARIARGRVVLRIEDLDHDRCRSEYATACLEDLRWYGLRWDEGPLIGGGYGPYVQSEREEFYRAAFEKLKSAGFLYPCTCSRKDILRAVSAPHAGEDEPIYPGRCRDRSPVSLCGASVPWRFRVPDGEIVGFEDGLAGEQRFQAGRDFGDFVVWRRDGYPSYQLAVVVDDAGMKISEVVRGADLLLSTARQILLYRALGEAVPSFYHCPLVTDCQGFRLSKRNDSLSLRTLRARGWSPEQVRHLAPALLMSGRPDQEYRISP